MTRRYLMSLGVAGVAIAVVSALAIPIAAQAQKPATPTAACPSEASGKAVDGAPDAVG